MANAVKKLLPRDVRPDIGAVNFTAVRKFKSESELIQTVDSATCERIRQSEALKSVDLSAAPPKELLLRVIMFDSERSFMTSSKFLAQKGRRKSFGG